MTGRVSKLLNEAHVVENRGGYYLTCMLVQRRANRRLLAEAAKHFRQAADMLDEALNLMNQGT